MATEIDVLIEQLRRPLYNYTMAKGAKNTMYVQYPDSYRKSVQTRLDNARKEIKDLVLEYVTEGLGYELK